MTDFAFKLIVRAIVLLTALPLHECAHAWAANKLGDPTAKNQGRMTLNPFVHLDPIGSITLLLCGVGWAKPVPINPFFFQKRKAGMALSALAGPTSNLLLAFLLYLLLKIAMLFSIVSRPYFILLQFLSIACQINISLAVFNLLPLPPLDGSRIFNLILPEKYYWKIMQYERYIQLGLFILLFTGLLDGPINFLYSLILKLFSALPFFY